MRRFEDIRKGFETILADKWWLAKVLLGGFLLINPFLLALAPTYFAGLADDAQRVDFVDNIFLYILAFNVLSFWFPLGFTYEVLRRARRGEGAQLPNWGFKVLPKFAFEGFVKLVISIFTLLLPAGIWMGLCWVIFCFLLGLPAAMLSMFLPPIMLLVIPLCGIACMRWLDGASILSSALYYPENIRLALKAWPEYLMASMILTGLNAVTTGFFYTIPFAAVFGLCLVDTWFGPIYAKSVEDEPSEEERTRQREDERERIRKEKEEAARKIAAEKEAAKKTAEEAKPKEEIEKPAAATTSAQEDKTIAPSDQADPTGPSPSQTDEPQSEEGPKPEEKPVDIPSPVSPPGNVDSQKTE